MRLRPPPNVALSRQGPFDRVRKAYTYAGKLTWQAASAHRIDASFFGDPARGNFGTQRNSALLQDDLARFSNLEYGGHNQAVTYSGVVSSSITIG